jgi:glucose/arabinose dehydrogenase
MAAAATLALSLIPAPAQALPSGTKVVTYKGGLDFVVDMASVEGTKKIFFTEKNTGRIRVLKGRNVVATPCADLDVNGSGERGLLGITLHPEFKKNHKLYVYYTNASPLEHRVTRFKVRNNRCRKPRHIITGIDASSSGYHNGGQLEFVGNKLFVSTGEAHDPSLAQSTSNRLGKILRYNADGSIPDGNPFSTPADHNPVWSYGHRNPFGLAHKPGTKNLY